MIKAGQKKWRGFGRATNPRQGAIHTTYYHAVACSVVLCVIKTWRYLVVQNLAQYFRVGNLVMSLIIIK